MSGESDGALPPCLAELVAACPRAGSCTEDAGSEEQQTRCFEDGTKEVWHPASECSGGELRVYKADGSLCYSVETTQPAASACETRVTV